MKKSHFSLRYCTIFLLLVAYTNVESIRTGHEPVLTKRKFTVSEKKTKTPMHKVEMTQRGYIQFLRWELPVPEITEYTFCLWVKSTNLTYAHSFFSYSKNEKERLIRSWISPRGQRIHLEINNVEIFQLPFVVQENRWHHLCQSWQSKDGSYAMWIDGRIEAEGYAREMVGHVIPSKGDIVVGQEYTDFDKGLEDGIEGSVLGFNLLLASAFDPYKTSFANAQRLNVFSISPTLGRSIDIPNLFSEFGEKLASRPSDKNNKITFEERTTNAYQKTPFDIFKKGVQDDKRKQIVFKEEASESERNNDLENFTKATIHDAPLGLQLVIISYSQCEIGRGSPFIGGPLMLISWTRTPVRVFGGAIVKSVESECGNF